MHYCTPVVALAGLLLIPVSARVVWIPAEFDPHDQSGTLFSRDTSNSCPDSFPSDFTCADSTVCLALNTTSAVKAVLCCPTSLDCSVIAPISCDQSMQNATISPNSQLHADPTTQLETCGSECCPMGYACKDGSCYAQSAVATPSTSASPSSAPSAGSGTTGSTTSTAAAATITSLTSPSPSSANASAPLGVPSKDSSHHFSGGSFAAGFVPGILLGAIIAACLLIFFRRKRRSSATYIDNEKQHSRDTLTDLTTLSRRPTMHGRSISEPTADPSTGHRTDFLRSTPPRAAAGEYRYPQAAYTVEASGPMTPARTPRAVKALFSRSPFMNQAPATPPTIHPPLPGHLKRGTLSFTISPVRALKKQKSMHSLRRQMTDVSRSSSRHQRPGTDRSGSTETIQVLMPSNEPYTPDQRPYRPTVEDEGAYGAHESSSTWPTTSSQNSTTRQQPTQQPLPIAERYQTQHITPTRPPGAAAAAAAAGGSALGTPYTPSNYDNGNGKGRVTDVLIAREGGLKVVREADRRDTTFSAMMERAGLRRSQLVMGTDGHGKR